MSINWDLSGRTRASGGKLFAKKLGKKLKTKGFCQLYFLMPVVSTKSGARAAGAFFLVPKAFGKFENLFSKRFS